MQISLQHKLNFFVDHQSSLADFAPFQKDLETAGTQKCFLKFGNQPLSIPLHLAAAVFFIYKALYKKY